MENLEWINVLRTMLELGWPAIVMIMIALLWRHHVRASSDWRIEYIALQREYISALREVAGLEKPLRPVAPPSLPEEKPGLG
jgi:hypothetical protein